MIASDFQLVQAQMLCMEVLLHLSTLHGLLFGVARHVLLCSDLYAVPYGCIVVCLSFMPKYSTST